MIGHGWFEIPGVQTGERDLQERVAPLRPLLRYARRATVLDLGCAEGLISKWLCDQGGARLVHGLDKHLPYLEMARTVLARRQYKARFDTCDFDHFESERAALALRPSYDIVLALNVIQKLKDPRAFLLTAAELANKIFVYSGPSRVIRDIRSDFVKVDVQKTLSQFDLIHFDHGSKSKRRGHLGVRMIFRRKRKSS